jgi:hypothetical protein
VLLAVWVSAVVLALSYSLPTRGYAAFALASLPALLVAEVLRCVVTALVSRWSSVGRVREQGV